jgi:hypothetical protein
VDGGVEAMIMGTIQQEDDCSWQDASKSWLEPDGEEEGGTCQGLSNQPPEAEKERPSGASDPPKKEEEEGEKEEVMEGSWWSPDPKELQVEEGGRDYFIELLMGGSSLDGALEGLSPAGSKKSRLAKKEAAQKGKPAASKGKGRSNGGAPKGGGELSTKPREEETDVRSGGEPKEGQPDSLGQGAPPNPPGDPGPRIEVMQVRTQPEARARGCK